MTDNKSQSIFSSNNNANTTTAYSGDALTWLNALPNGQSHTDLVGLDSEFAIRCIHELVDFKNFELPLQVGHPSNEHLLHFYFEARNREKVFGTKNLAIGYPFVLARVAGYEVAAPLFLWPIQLEPHPQNTDAWMVQRLDSKQITPNYPFFHLVDAFFSLQLSSKVRQLAENKTLTAQALTDICEELRRKLGLNEDGLPLSIQSLPADQSAAQSIAGGHLIWGGVAGIFPTLPRTTITQPPVVAPDLPADAGNWGHLFSLLPLDPTQRSVFLAMQQNALTVVEGASGTGKTYLISALATNALANGKKCLVVSKSIHSLRRAQKFLLEKGFGDVSFILRDIQGDQLMLADMLRMAADNKNKVSYDEEMFNAVLNKTLRIQDGLDESWTALHKPVFGDQNFSDTVGQFLHANRLEGKELLVSQLNPSDFGFARDEYDSIIAAIGSSEPLFRRFPILQHPLSKLHHRVFLDHTGSTGLDWTQTQVRKLLQDATALHHQFITKTNDYGEALLDHYEQYYLHLQTQVNSIRNGLADGTLRYGADFEKPASTTEKLYGVFSDRYKEIVASKAKISADFEELFKMYGFRKYFEFDFPPQLDVRNIRKVSELSKGFEAALQMWRKRIPGIVREDVRRLNVKSIHNELDYRDDVRELEHSMDAFIESFNDAELYEETLRHEMLTVPKRQEFLELMIAQLEETQFYLRDFDDFYIWQHHWLSLKPAAQKVVRALCKIKPDNWSAAFESWYLYHLLLKEFHPGLVWDAGTVQNMHDSARSLRNLMPMQISALWQARKAKALRQLKSSDGTAFKTWFGKNNRSLAAQKRFGLESAAYIAHEWQVQPRLKLLYGLRVSAFNVLGAGDFYTYDQEGNVLDTMVYQNGKMVKTYVNLEPRLALSYLISDRQSLKFGYNRNTQYLHLLSNSTSGNPTDLWMPTTNNVKPEIADQIALGYFHNFEGKGQVELSVETYYKTMQNQLDYRNGADVQGNSNVEGELLYGPGRAYGLELLLKKRSGRLTGWVGYTLARTERKIEGINQGAYYPAKQDRTHEISIVAMYQLSRRWALSGTWIYYTGNAVTFPSGKYSVNNATAYYYTERNAYRMPNYHRLDLGATFQARKTKRFESEWAFSAFNAYNRLNAYTITFRDSKTEPGTTEAVKTSLFGIVPAVSWNFKF